MSTKAIGTLGNIDLINIGGFQFTNLSTLKILVWNSSNGASNCSPREPGVSSAYQVPNGKKFQMWVVQWQGTVTATRDMHLAYCDNDVGFGTSTAPTNPVYLGDTASLSVAFDAFSGVQNNAIIMRFDVPAGKYIFINGASTGDAIAGFFFGYEVDA